MVAGPGLPLGLEARQAHAAFLEAIALHQQGRLDAAARLYDAVIQAVPRHHDALHMRGVAALQQGQAEEGIALVRKALKLNPKFPAAWNSLGNGLREARQLVRAVEAFDKAVAQQPSFAEAYSNRGNALADLGRFVPALASYDKAVALRPEYAEAWSNRGRALMELGRMEEALQSCDTALALRSDFAAAHANRASVLIRLGRPRDALEASERAIGFARGLATAHATRAAALQDLGRAEEALASFDQAVVLNPGLTEAAYNRARLLMASERFDEAIASYTHAIDRRPDYADARWNRSLALLLLGRLEEGWPEHEWRKRKTEPVAARSFRQPLWLGREPIAGKRLFLHAEQGLGDTIQFCRYALLAQERGAQLVMSVQDALVPLLGQLHPAIKVIGAEQKPDAFDFHAPLHSLPLAFGTTLATVPAWPAYLKAPSERVARWASHLGSQGRKIGINWQGSTGATDAGRSFPLSQFLPLAQVPGVRLISLHKGAGEAQLDDLPPGMVETLGPDFDPAGAAFLDSAAVIQLCDLVITSDTALAHLAGALGVPTWLILQRIPDWRWLLGREDSPWYPNMRLFRQEIPGDWDEVFGRILTALQA
jgi:tetratricopeptide (TPR) repeat protein